MRYPDNKVRVWLITAALALAASVGLAQLAAQGIKAQGVVIPAAWQKLPNTPSDVDFRSVFVVTTYADSIYAVGKRGDEGAFYLISPAPLDGWRVRFDLTPENTFTFRAPLNAVVATFNRIWAVGERGLIAYRSGVFMGEGSWSEMQNPVPDANLRAIQMLGQGEEGWAVGVRDVAGTTGEPVLLHFANGRWERDTSITTQGGLNALHFASSNSGWAVGTAGIWHYRNGEWRQEQEPEICPTPGCYSNLASVRAINEDEVWVMGDRIALCAICRSVPYALHRLNGRWQRVLPETGIPDNPYTQPTTGSGFNAVTFAGPIGNTEFRFGYAVGGADVDGVMRPFAAEYNIYQGTPQWHYSTAADATGYLNSVSLYDVGRAVAVGTGGLVMSYGYGPQPPPELTPTPAPSPGPGINPTNRVTDPHLPGVSYFAEVGHTLRGGFKDYWLGHGGLPQFGYPVTEEFREVSLTDNKTYTVQYFERARFEWHPENRPPYDVLLGLLGRTVTQGRANEPSFMPAQPDGRPGSVYFQPTAHNMAPEFAPYWRAHGGLPVYGYPISEPLMEKSPTDGKTYLVQYFERNRLEWHPELPEPFKVSLGLLGAEILRERGWLK